MSDVATVAGLIADPVRAGLILALMDGAAWTSGELAACVGASPQLASHHLARLAAGGIAEVRSSGRHRYYRLSSPEMAAAVEALATAGAMLPGVRARPVCAPEILRQARACYDHLAGRLGVAVAERVRVLALVDADGRATGAGEQLLSCLGQTALDRRPSRCCLDWSERREHLAGGFASDLLNGLLERAMVVRGPVPRALQVTPAGRTWFRLQLGLAWPPAAATKSVETRGTQTAVTV